jgi:hypothetical protein
LPGEPAVVVAEIPEDEERFNCSILYLLRGDLLVEEREQQGHLYT